MFRIYSLVTLRATKKRSFLRKTKIIHGFKFENLVFGFEAEQCICFDGRRIRRNKAILIALVDILDNVGCIVDTLAIASIFFYRFASSPSPRIAEVDVRFKYYTKRFAVCSA